MDGVLTQNSPDVAGCVWLDMRSDWLDLILSALSYLSAEVGAVSSFDPLPFFLPVVEFRDRIDHWKWMGGPPLPILLSPSHWPLLPPPPSATGHDRDSEVELLVLCNHWLDTLDRSLVTTHTTPHPSPPHTPYLVVFPHPSHTPAGCM